MFDLYFNDCLPQSFDSSKVPILDGMRHIYDMIKSQGVTVNNGIVLSNTANNVYVNGNTLLDHIKMLPLEERSFFMAALYMRQTIEEIINDYPSDEAIQYLYDCKFNGRCANNLAAAGIMNYIALTLPAENELVIDKLSIEVKNPDNEVKMPPISVTNFHGGNLKFILDIITPPAGSKLEQLIRGFTVLGKRCHTTPEFENIWNNLNSDFQDGIISRFEDARNAGLVFPPGNDGNIVKDDREGTNVFELREKAHFLRIYFKSGLNSIVIGWYGTKTKFYGADQSSDFRHADKIIDEYIAKHNIVL